MKTTKILIRVFNTYITISMTGRKDLELDEAINYVARLKLSETAVVKEIVHNDGTVIKNKDYKAPYDILGNQYKKTA